MKRNQRWKTIWVLDNNAKAIKKYELNDKEKLITVNKKRCKRRKFDRQPFCYVKRLPKQSTKPKVKQSNKTLSFNNIVIFDRRNNLKQDSTISLIESLSSYSANTASPSINSKGYKKVRYEYDDELGLFDSNDHSNHQIKNDHFLFGENEFDSPSEHVDYFSDNHLPENSWNFSPDSSDNS